ncbi:MAG: hypothetical protein NTY19_21095 [Planctomycetota bacterium]|nr:hypothetical protein [Planctomycetota bacterium]
MASGFSSDDFYTRVLECGGFCRDGRPLAGAVWSAAELRSSIQSASGNTFDQIDRAFKYHAVLRPETQAGKLGISHIFEVAQSPCIYFKRWDAEPEAAELAQRLLTWQQAAWNDGRTPMLWVVSPTHVRILNAYVRPREVAGAAICGESKSCASRIWPRDWSNFGELPRENRSNPAGSGRVRQANESTAVNGSIVN